MAALVVLVIFERRRPCGARCTGHLRASRLTVPPSPGEGEFVRSGRAIFGAVETGGRPKRRRVLVISRLTLRKTLERNADVCPLNSEISVPDTPSDGKQRRTHIEVAKLVFLDRSGYLGRSAVVLSRLPRRRG